MSNVFRVLGAVAAVFSLATSAGAKGPTLKITIQGGGMRSPLEITDPAVRQFHVWDGAGTFVNGVERLEGFIVDWKAGTIGEPPEELPRYEVSFHVVHNGPRAYVSGYVWDPVARRGYVKIVGGPENTNLIVRGVEGQWFRAAEVWDKFASPLLGRAARP